MDAYLDESSDEKQQHVFAVAGFVAAEEVWLQFNLLWRSRTTGLPVFHMSQCETNKDPFSPANGWTKNTCTALITDLITALLGAPIFGFGCAVFIEDFKSLFPTEPVESIYLLCFRHCVYELVQMSPEPVGFTFDSHKVFSKTAHALYDRVKATAGMTWKPKLGALGFDNRETITPLQPADLIAYETMKAYRNRRYHPEVPERRSISRLAGKVAMHAFGYDALKVIADEMAEKGYGSVWDYLSVKDLSSF